MRSRYLWLTVIIVSMFTIICVSGCLCKGSHLDAEQTPVVLAKEQRLLVRPVKGGPARVVRAPAGFLVVDPPAMEPELKP